MWDITEAVTYYKRQGAPSDQTALTALLKEAQQENGGGIPHYCVAAMAEQLNVKPSYLLALIKRIPSLRLQDTHLLEMCAGPNCGKRTELAALAEKLCKANPKVTLKFTQCMRMCGKRPNLKWDGKIYNGADEALLRSLLDM